MSMINLQEQEQLDALKTWWKDNGKWLIAALVIALAAYGALTYWKHYQGKQAAEASTLYDEVLKQVASNDPKRINDSVAALVEKYSNTAYAPRAQLLAVGQYAD